MLLPLRLQTSRLAISATQARFFRSITTSNSPYKDAQDKDSLKPRSTQNTVSGRDDDLVDHPKAAFKQSQNAPETEREAAGENANGNPLEASGANQDLSKPQGDEKTNLGYGAGKNINTQKASTGGGQGKKKGTPRKVT